MCLAVPARVIAVQAEQYRASVSLGGIVKEVAIDLVPEVRVDDYVLIHVGYALNILDQAEAEKTLALLDEAGIL